MTKIASRFAGARDEAQKGQKIARASLAVQMNFGDADDPDALARRLLDMAARLDAAAGHYRAAAAEAQSARRDTRQKPATYETRMGWI